MTFDSHRILLTGGSGRLGTELRIHLPGMFTPGISELDITDYNQIQSVLDSIQPQVVIHAAAYTDVAGAETNKEQCWKVNVDGTRNLVRALSNRKIFLIHISTDYVFNGLRGLYKEEDQPDPVRNFYALSKLVAEEIVQLASEYLIIRTSFRPREWPYPVAFQDVYTSQDYIDRIAPDIALAIQHYQEIPYKIIHIATERKSAYELAKRRKPDVLPGSKRDLAVNLPDDVSLDCTRWENLKRKWEQKWKSA